GERRVADDGAGRDRGEAARPVVEGGPEGDAATPGGVSLSPAAAIPGEGAGAARAPRPTGTAHRGQGLVGRERTVGQGEVRPGGNGDAPAPGGAAGPAIAAAGEGRAPDAVRPGCAAGT